MNTIAWITSKNEQYDIKDIEARKTKLNIEDLPKNLSAFSNDMGFIDNTVNNLINYYKKSETYTKNEIDQKLSAKWDSKFVDELPTEDISTTTIYFLKRKKEQGTTQYDSDVYDEYIYTGTWELIGNTYVDLTDYYRKNEVEEVIDGKVLVETNNRITSENELKNNIDNINNYAKSIENNLNSETSTRQNNDLLHDTKINEVESNINSEISRAKSAENTLSNRCDTYDSHIANIDNPHSVTKEQIGLGNVTNVSTTDTITLNSEKNITSGAVYKALENKVDKIDGRGLSEQNFTYAEKTKLAGLENYDDTSIQSRISANENAITTLNGDSSVSGSVDKKIADAIAGVTQIDFKIVSLLPSIGVKGTIYLIRGTGTETTQQYDEYIWLDDKWEKLGKSTIEVDLSDFYKKTEVNALVSVKNDKITVTDDSTALTDTDTFSTTSNTGTNPTNITKRSLSLLWTYIKGKADNVYAKLSHTHTKSEITDFAHTHDDRYFTETEITNKLAGKSDTGHTHDDRYYTETEIDTKLSNKVDKVSGKGLSTNDYTTEEKNKLSGLDNYDDTAVKSSITDLQTQITSNKTAIESEEKRATTAENNLSTSISSVSTNLSSHTGNKSNPHGVTKSQVGLGNVPNVATNDQTPTYTVASENTALTSGEKLSVAFGKIAKAISSLISHLANKSNPHGVTKAQVGLGNVVNTGDSATPTSGGTTKFTTGGAYTLKQAIDKNTTAIATLNGTGNGSVAKTVADKIAEVVAGAPESLDTLKEISDWIDTHEDSASAMNTAIQANATAISDEAKAREDSDKALQNAIDGKAAASHTHDDRYYTESEMNTKLSGKANSSHTHTKSQITDFPISLKNPNALTFGSKTYDGSAAKTITAADLGALTQHQPVDDALSETSENPVQNKIVNNVINFLNKQLTTKANKGSKLQDYGITDAYTREETNSLLSGVMTKSTITYDSETATLTISLVE